MIQLVLDLIREVLFGTTPEGSSRKQFKRDFIVRGIFYSLAFIIVLFGIIKLPEMRLLLTGVLLVIIVGFVVTTISSLRNRNSTNFQNPK
ncbi:hypothetical protein E0L10_01950 [Enterococcus durans]|uniref:hypothetical protein n=1 Tax=Enterococcus durans TaxID=53345 RepID=UPI001431EFD7|nr:hypothetical protein [Enterococcus durans]NJE62974.1 hypothetical protein [Enterococcus durans]